MAKSQKKRRTRRHNPVRVPDSHLPKGLEAAAATSSRRDAVFPIIQKLESVDAQERSWACSAVSNLIQNDPSTRRLLQGKNIVGALITRLSDSVEEVIVEAAGALRNLCVDGGFGICAEMYNKNILAPLKTLLSKISNAMHQLLTAPKSTPENAAELVFGLAENVITLIWCLSETSNKALNVINEIRLVPFLMAFLENWEKLPSKTVASALQCLYVLTDDNPPVTDELRSNSSSCSCLLSVARSECYQAVASGEAQETMAVRLIFVRLLAAGILRNISPIPAPSVASTVDIDRSIILPLVEPILASASLEETTSKVLELVSKKDEEPIVDKPSLKNTPKSDHRTPSEKELDIIESKLRNVQLGLEILTGVCATLPDPDLTPVDAETEEDSDGDNDNENDNESDVNMDADEPESSSKIDDIDPGFDAPSFLPTILSPLLTLIHPTSLSFPPLPSGPATVNVPPPVHLPTTSVLGAIHISALECLNNACLALALTQDQNPSIRADAETGRRLWITLWSTLESVGIEGGRGQGRRREMWEVAVGVLWGISRIWKGSIIPEEEQVRLLMQLCDASTDAQIEVKCIGALECLAQCPDAIEANQIISAYLLNIVSSGPTPTLTSEPIFQAASALIDIYSDESLPYDINFRQNGYLQALVDAVDSVRRAVRSVDRKKEGGRALRSRGEETLENLKAFVKYRRNLRL